MVSNISFITETIGNINVTIDPINTTDIINTAIVSSNESTSGWLGIFILCIFGFAIFVHIIKNETKFGIQERSTLLLIVLGVILDFIFFIYKLKILDNIQIIVFIYTLFVVIGAFSFFKKEVQSPDS